MQGVKHYFIDSHNLQDEVTAAQFEREALRILEELFLEHDEVILTGGSGMFVDALCIGLDPIPKNDAIKAQLINEFDDTGLFPLLDELEQKDPEYFKEVDPDNHSRVIRALEVIRSTNKTYSSFRQNKPTARPFEVVRFAINHDRKILYDRINLRVDLMMKAGLLNEAKEVYPLKELKSLNTVGYKELFDYFDGKLSLEDAINQIKQNSRRYAKRQITWLKRHPETKWIDYKSIEKMTAEIIDLLNVNNHSN